MLKRYMGPFKRVVKDKTLIPAVPMNGKTTGNYGLPTQWVQNHPGFIPASSKHYDTLLTPGFKKLQSEGYIIQCPFFLTSESYAASPANFSETVLYGSPLKSTVTLHENICGYYQGVKPSIDTSLGFQDRSRAKDEALTRAWAKANTGNADLLIDLSQMKGTISMFVNTGKTLLALASNYENFVKVGKAILRGRDRYVVIPPGSKVPISSLSGYWCELRFGWGPLLSSILGVAEALSREDLNKPKRVTYRAQENFNHVVEKTTPAVFTWTNGCISINEVAGRTYEKFEYVSTFRAGILLEEELLLRQALGIDLKQVPIALWDLVTLSFIVDRFINIGNWIRSLNPVPVSRFGGSWVTEKYQSTYTRRFERDYINRFCGTGTSYRNYTRTASVEVAVVTRSGYIRTIHERPPWLPTLRHDWSKILNLFNAVDGIMLAIQRIMSHLPRAKRN